METVACLRSKWGTGQKPPDKKPPIMMKSKMVFFIHFFYIDGDIKV